MTIPDDSSGRDARWHPKPHHQIVAMALVALTALITVSIVLQVRIGQIDTRYHRVADREIPIVSALTGAQMLYEANLGEATQLLGPLSEADRATSVSDLAEKTRLADHEWDVYKRLATGVSGEAQLQAIAERTEAEQIRLITPVLTSSPVASATAARIVQAGARHLDAVDTLRTRYATKQTDELAGVAVIVGRTRRDLLVTAGSELAFLLLAFGAVYFSVRRRDRQVRTIELERRAEAGRNDLETRLARSLELVHTEDAMYPRVQRAIAEVSTGRSSEMLIAASSDTGLRQVLASGAAADGDGCGVGRSEDCPAATRGQTQVFARSDALDACPFLDQRRGGACAAACVPVSIGGKTLGVVHVTTAPDDPPADEMVTRLEIIARKAGDRIGVLRAFTRSEADAHTDQLTGLLNRRSLDDALRRIEGADQQYAIAFGDLDHFKQINDLFGHDSGDRALKLFARVLRDSVRPGDIPARFGGEEFVVILPDCSVADASRVLERVRENLARAIATSGLPPFTVSFGLTNSHMHAGFESALKAADDSLAEAKATGRDRVVAWTVDAPAFLDQLDFAHDGNT